MWVADVHLVPADHKFLAASEQPLNNRPPLKECTGTQEIFHHLILAVMVLHAHFLHMPHAASI